MDYIKSMAITILFLFFMDGIIIFIHYHNYFTFILLRNEENTLKDCIPSSL